MTTKTLRLFGVLCFSCAIAAQAQTTAPSSPRAFLRVDAENQPMIPAASLHLGLQVNRVTAAASFGYLSESSEYSDSYSGGSTSSDKSSEGYLLPGIELRLYLSEVPEQGLAPFLYGSASTSIRISHSNSSTSAGGLSTSSSSGDQHSLSSFGLGIGEEYFLQKASIGARMGYKRFSSEITRVQGTSRSKSIAALSWLNTAVFASYRF